MKNESGSGEQRAAVGDASRDVSLSASLPANARTLPARWLADWDGAQIHAAGKGKRKKEWEASGSGVVTGGRQPFFPGGGAAEKEEEEEEVMFSATLLREFFFALWRCWADRQSWPGNFS